LIWNYQPIMRCGFAQHPGTGTRVIDIGSH